jgi:pSer/pThr/pTyr-binding forkhead associated (FHA) protein
MQLKLKVLTGSHAGSEIEIKTDKFLIGRSDECHLRPKSEAISRRHCAIIQKDGKALVIDLKSRNGTQLNDKLIGTDKAKILKNGDRLGIGTLEFEVLLEVGLGGIKRPKVLDVKEAAKRTVGAGNTPDSRYEEIDVSQWLLEEDAKSPPPAPAVVNETQQFLADDDVRFDVQQSEGDAGSAAAEDEGAEAGAGEEPGKEGSQGPMKLPKLRGKTAADSRQAASETLRRYFGGGR